MLKFISVNSVDLHTLNFQVNHKCVCKREKERENERKRERGRDYGVIKGQEVRRGFRVEVQYSEFGFRLRRVMKKAEFYSSVSLCTTTKQKRKEKEKRKREKVTGFISLSLPWNRSFFFLTAH